MSTAAPPTAADLPDRDGVMAQAGAENFTVASALVGHETQRHLRAIYGFARLVDDVGARHAVFRDYSKYDKFRVAWQAIQQRFCVVAFENVERLLFQQDLLEFFKVIRQFRRGMVWDRDVFFGERLGYQLRARRFLNAMRRELRELRIVFGVNAAVRNQKHAPLACCVGEPPDIVQQLFRAGNVQFAARGHEVFLRVHLPENYFLRDHSDSCGFMNKSLELSAHIASAICTKFIYSPVRDSVTSMPRWCIRSCVG